MERKFVLQFLQVAVTFPVQRQINPAHTHPPTDILTSTSRSPMWFYPVRLSTKVLYAFVISHIHGTCPLHLILLDLIILTLFNEELKL